MEYLKSKFVWVITACGLLILILGYGVGKSTASVPLDEGKVKYEELQQKIKEKEKELSDLNDEIEEKTEEKENILAEVTENKKTFDEAMKIIDNKVELLEEIKELETQISSKKSEIEKLNADIDSKNAELAKVTGQIKEKEEAPKELSAGQFIVGQDIPAGRYKVVPIGRGSNFVVYDSSGQLFVNTIISNTSGHGVPEYVTYLNDGYIIDSSTPAKYIPVE